MLREANLEAMTAGRSGRVSAAALRAVLRAIDDHGPPASPSVATLARETGSSRRTVQRALACLQAADLVAVQIRSTQQGRQSNLYAINWTELARRCRPGSQGATMAPQSATMAPQSATMARAPAPPWRPNRPFETTIKRSKAGAVDEGGEIDPLEDQESRRAANRINRTLRCRSPLDRQLVAQVATLQVRGFLSDDDVEQALESVRLKKPDRPAAWFRICLSNAVGPDRFRALLAAVDISPALKI